MLHRQLLDRFLIGVTVVAALALAAPGVEAARADAAQVTVLDPGGAQQTLSLDLLAGSEDVLERGYSLRAGTGATTQVITGFSLAALLEAAGADPYSFSYLEVLRPAGGSVLLSRDQALDEGAFPDGPPVVYAAAAGTGFLRPSGGPEDVNASDSFEAPQGVTIALRKGSPLRVRAEASTLRTRPGKAVKFTAVVDRAGAGESLAYSWYFDDGGSATGATATHSFERRGSYDVVVGVTTPGDSAGASAVVTVQVGAPLAGPDRKGGGTQRDREAPDHGAATRSMGTGADASMPPGPTPSTSAATAQPSQSTPPERLTKARDRTEPPPSGERVSGRLLTATPQAPAEDRTPVAARSGKLEGEEGAGFSVPGAALGLVVTAGLLGAGALTESRSLFR